LCRKQLRYRFLNISDRGHIQPIREMYLQSLKTGVMNILLEKTSFIVAPFTF